MVSLATTQFGPLGCGSYVTRLVNDGRVILEAAGLQTAQWGRRVDEPSTAALTIPVAGTNLEACCNGMSKVDALRTEVIIERDQVPVWQGWLMRDVSIRRDTIVVNAHDILEWTNRRTLKLNHVHAGVDLTDIALDYFADVNAAGDLPIVITSEASGVTATRTVLSTEDRYAGEALKELYDTGLDATVVAGAILLGPETPTCGILKFSDDDIDGDPEIKTDGARRASRVVVKGADGVRAIAQVVGDPCYHAADFVHTDENIHDQDSAQAAADALLEQMSASYPWLLGLPEGATLKPSAPVHINALIPGSSVQFHTSRLCVDLDMGFRLTAVDVEVTGGSESVRCSFEPLGDSEGVAA